MDPVTGIGAAASILQLVGSASALAKTLKRLYQSIESAPEELASVVKQVDFATRLLQCFLWTQYDLEKSGNEADRLPSHLIKTLSLSLLAVREAAEALETICEQLNTGKLGLRARIRWSFLDKSVADQNIRRLREVTTDLIQVVHPIELRLIADSNQLLTKIHAKQDIILAGIEKSVKDNNEQICWSEKDTRGTKLIKLTSTESAMSPLESTLQVSTTYNTKENRSLSSCLPVQLLALLKACGISLSINYFGNRYKSTYAFACRIALPTFFGQRALILELTTRQNHISSWMNLTLLHGNLAIGRLVTCNSEIWNACTTGNVDEVKELILTRRATPHDRLGACSRKLGQWTKHLGFHGLFCDANSSSAAGICRGGGESLLDAAIWSGNFNLVRFLLDLGVNVNSASFYQRSPIHVAFQKGDLQIIDYLLIKGASLDYVGCAGDNVLHKLIRTIRYRGALSICVWTDQIGRPLLKYLNQKLFEDFDTPDHFGTTPLYQCALAGASDYAADLLRLGAKVSPPNRNWIHAAANGGSPEILKSFLSLVPNATVELNSRDEAGKTPLHLAFWVRPISYDSIKTLVEGGSSIDSQDNLGRTPIFDAILASSGVPEEADDHRLCEILLQERVGINTIDHSGNTPLHEAARYCNLDVTKALLMAGSSINSKNHRGETPLHLAAAQWYRSKLCRGSCYIRTSIQARSVSTLATLLSAGANPHVATEYRCDSADTIYAIQLTPWGLARLSCIPDVEMEYLDAVRMAGIAVDLNGDDLFWDADESTESPDGYGSCYETSPAGDPVLGQAKLYREIWQLSAAHCVRSKT